MPFIYIFNLYVVHVRYVYCIMDGIIAFIVCIDCRLVTFTNSDSSTHRISFSFCYIQFTHTRDHFANCARGEDASYDTVWLTLLAAAASPFSCHSFDAICIPCACCRCSLPSAIHQICFLKNDKNWIKSHSFICITYSNVCANAMLFIHYLFTGAIWREAIRRTAQSCCAREMEYCGDLHVTVARWTHCLLWHGDTFSP